MQDTAINTVNIIQNIFIMFLFYEKDFNYINIFISNFVKLFSIQNINMVFII